MCSAEGRLPSMWVSGRRAHATLPHFPHIAQQRRPCILRLNCTGRKQLRLLAPLPRVRPLVTPDAAGRRVKALHKACDSLGIDSELVADDEELMLSQRRTKQLEALISKVAQVSVEHLSTKRSRQAVACGKRQNPHPSFWAHEGLGFRFQKKIGTAQ